MGQTGHNARARRLLLKPDHIKAVLQGRQWMVILVLLLPALVIRLPLFNVVTLDLDWWVFPWYDFLLDHGFSAIGSTFPNKFGEIGHLGNYPPPYHYLLYLATLFDGFLPRIYLIKSVSVLFDIVAACFMFKIVEHRFGSSRHAWVGFFAVLLAPTVIANSSFWGQCDSIHGSLMLGCVYFSLKDRSLLAVALLGIALSFKAQAVFLFPYILMLAFSGRLRWGYLFAIPLVFTGMMLPAAFLGRPPFELLTVYFDQASLYHRLSMNAPNLYFLVSNDFYRVGLVAGITVTIIVSLLFAMVPGKKRTVLSTEFLLLAATMSVAVTPFLLPKMHDRYFFSADLFSIALAIYIPRLWFVAVGFQVSSLLAYIPIISSTLNGSEGQYTVLMPFAIAVNTCLVGLLAAIYWYSVYRVPVRDLFKISRSKDAVSNMNAHSAAD